MLNAWGDNPADINASEFCVWCERMTYTTSSGPHYNNCTRNTDEAKEWEYHNVNN